MRRHHPISPDGRKVAGRGVHTSWTRSHIRIWDLETGRDEMIFPGAAWRAADAMAIAFSPHGKLLVLDAQAKVMVEADSGRVAFDLKRPDGRRTDLGHFPTRWHPLGRTDCVLFYDHEIASIVNCDTGELRAKFPHKSMMSSHVIYAVSANGQKLAALTGGATPHIFDSITGTVWDFPHRIYAMELSPDGRWLVGVHPDHRQPLPAWASYLPWMKAPMPRTNFDLYDLTWSTQPIFLRKYVTLAQFSPDGSTLALVVDQTTVELWDFPLGAPWSYVIGTGLLAAALSWLLGSRPVVRTVGLPFGLIAPRTPTFCRLAARVREAIGW